MSDTQNQPIDNVRNHIIMMRNQPVLLDRDVAALYGVETKRINEAVRRNAEKFPPDYRFPLQHSEIQQLVANCDRFKTLKHSSTAPYAFTEKGLYMLATILKSPMAVEATFSSTPSSANAATTVPTSSRSPKSPTAWRSNIAPRLGGG